MNRHLTAVELVFPSEPRNYVVGGLLLSPLVGSPKAI